MCWQYVTEVQVVDASGTEKSTCTHVLPVGLHNSENIPEDEEWTPISSSGETSSSSCVASMPSTTPRSKDLAAKIAYVTNIHALLQFCFAQYIIAISSSHSSPCSTFSTAIYYWSFTTCCTAYLPCYSTCLWSFLLPTFELSHLGRQQHQLDLLFCE